MSWYLITLFIIIGILVLSCVIYLIYYIITLPKRRKNNEIIRRQKLILDDEIEAERVKQKARVADYIARKNIEDISKRK